MIEAISIVLSMISSFAITIFCIPYLIHFTRTIGFLDCPDGVIKSQNQPVPYVGGIAFYTVISLILLFLSRCFALDATLFFSGLSCLFFTGFIDDWFILTVRGKLLGQFVGVFVFVFFNIYFGFFPVYFEAYFYFLFAFLWALFIINAINLVDVMDGLSSLISLVAATMFLYIGLHQKDYFSIVLLSALLGTIGGFLLYNRPPARIYMGDAGSLLIGGIFAFISLRFNWEAMGKPYFSVFFIPIVILAIPLLEVLFLLCIRTYYGIPFYRGSRHHFCHYMQKNGWSKGFILAYILFCGVIQLIGVHFLLKNGMSILSFLMVSIFFITLWIFVCYAVKSAHYSFRSLFN